MDTGFSVKDLGTRTMALTLPRRVSLGKQCDLSESQAFSGDAHGLLRNVNHLMSLNQLTQGLMGSRYSLNEVSLSFTIRMKPIKWSKIINCCIYFNLIDYKTLMGTYDFLKMSSSVIVSAE